jgi:hypothetical protein
LPIVFRVTLRSIGLRKPTLEEEGCKGPGKEWEEKMGSGSLGC